MNTTTLEAEAPETTDKPESLDSGWASNTDSDDFQYKVVSPWGPVALVLGLASTLGLTNSLFGLVLAFLTIILSVFAVVRIYEVRDTYRGLGMAVSGLILSTFCLIAGSWKLHYDYHHEVPEGYQRVSFPNEISDRKFVYFGQARRLHEKVAPLVGNKLFLKGYMYNLEKLDGIKEFIFLKDNGECCFGGEPKPYDMMMVKMPEGKTTRAYQGMIAVSGTLHADVNAPEGEAVYTVDADIVEEARTGF